MPSPQHSRHRLRRTAGRYAPGTVPAALLGLAAFAAGAAAGDGGPIFSDETAAAGIDFVHFTGASGSWYFPEIAGAGGALLDYDGDGDLDLFLVQGTMLPPGADPATAHRPPAGPLSDRLYRNDSTPAPGGGKRLRFIDVTEEAGLAGERGYGMGAAAGDYDGDGDADLYVTNFGSNVLWRNRGDGTFEDVTARAGADDPRWSVAAAFFDYDRDGDLDLYVGNYVDFTVATNQPCTGNSGVRDYCGPKAYDPVADRLLRNRGDGTFEDVTARAGIAAPGAALGVVAADFDLDGWLDLYVANDGAPNFLWINRRDGTFEDEAMLRGCAVNGDGMAEASMGTEYADIDGDGDDDLFLTHLVGETNTLYVNDGTGMFLDRTTQSGLGRPSFAHTGFGTSFLDYDNDGRLDALVVNGAVKAIDRLRQARDPLPFHEPDHLFENVGGGRFEPVPPAAAGPHFERSEIGRGALVGDLDDDGDPDVVVTNNSGPARLLVNQVGSRRSWIGVRPVTGAGRDEPGTRVEVRTAGGAAYPRVVRPATGYAGSNDPRLLFGLGDDRGPVTATARWPDGGVESWAGLEPGRYHTLRRGTGKPAAAAGGGRGGR